MHRQNVFAAAINLSGDRVITGSANGEVLVWSVPTFVPVRDLPAAGKRGKISALALSPNGSEALVAPDWSATVEQWDVEAAAARGTLAAHTGRTTALAYHPSSAMIATGGADRLAAASGQDDDEDDDAVPAMAAPTVRLWKDGAKVHELTGLDKRIGAIAFSADGALVAAGGQDAVKVWRTADGAEVATYALPGESATVAFRNETVCAISSDGGACFTAKGSTAIEGARAPTTAALITDKWTASGTYEQIEVRSAADGALRATIPGRAYAIVGAGDDMWAILTDRAIPVRAGAAAAPIVIKVPQK